MRILILFFRFFLLPLHAKLMEDHFPKVFFSAKSFLHPEQGEYLETQLLFDAQSFDFYPTDSERVASFVVTQLFKQGDAIISFDKAVVNSTLLKDELKKNFYFIEKFILPPGVYDYEMTIKDKAGVLNTLIFL